MATKKSREDQVSGRAGPARMPCESPAVPCSFPCPRGTATGPTGSRPRTRRHVGGMKHGQRASAKNQKRAMPSEPTRTPLRGGTVVSVAPALGEKNNLDD